MRPIIKTTKLDSNGSPLEYKAWTDAKPELVGETGEFCAYCGKQVNRVDLQVDHVYGKRTKDTNGNLKYDHLKYRWDNFLLSCINCNTTKGKKDVAVLQPFLPHINNLLHFIEVINGGTVQIKQTVTGVELLRTLAFIDLVGLDRKPGDPDFSDKDDRWDCRLKVYDIATRQRVKYCAVPQTTDIENIVDLASSNGQFAIWYCTFIGIDPVIDALINGITIYGAYKHPFPGTHSASFDPNNHFTSLARP